MSDEQQDKKLAIKFLITKSNAGSLIGTGGKAIKELIAITEARVSVSGVNDVYPGSNDRVVYITGSMETVSATQHLIHEMLGLTAVSSEKNFEWNPALAAENPGQNDDTEITSKISIPASAGGLILGKQGNTLRSIMETSEAKVVMTAKDDALFTQERILTISGTVRQCIDCVDLVLNKLAEEEDIPQFVNRGTTYRSGPFNGRTGPGKGPNRGGIYFCYIFTMQRFLFTLRNGVGSEIERLSDGVATTITIEIPNDLIGNIFGKQVSCPHSCFCTAIQKLLVL